MYYNFQTPEALEFVYHNLLLAASVICEVGKLCFTVLKCLVEAFSKSLPISIAKLNISASELRHEMET